MTDFIPPASPASQGSGKLADLPALLFLAMAAFAQGCYATILNRMYYATQAPFYDSMSYDNSLAEVLSATRDHGFLAGLDRASHCATVALPYLLAVFAGPFVHPSRALGIWLQVPWVFALLVSCYAMFRIRSGASPWMAAFLALPFSFISAIFNYQGGLSDFRMDLGLYLLFGCAFCWLAIAVETRKLIHWAACGLFIGLAALTRAIAPVFIGLVFVPILVLRFAFSPGGRKNLIFGISLAAFEAALVSGWFYSLRYRDLYHYYVVWNPDANAHLPLSVSIHHFKFALDSVGRWMLGGCLLAVGLTIPWKGFRFADVVKEGASWPWETIFAAFMPAAFLAARGAGLNSFVSMPSSFGIVALILAMRGNWRAIGRFRGVLAGAVLCAACGLSAILGYGRHSSVRGNPSAGYWAALESVAEDSRKHKLGAVQFTSIGIGNLCADSLLNILVFDLGYGRVEGLAASSNSLTMDAGSSPLFTSITYSDWCAIPGENDSQRMEHLVGIANSSVDYIFIPSDATLAWLETRRSFIFMNHYSRWMKQEILANPAWKPVSQEIVILPSESYTVYANRSRLPQ